MKLHSMIGAAVMGSALMATSAAHAVVVRYVADLGPEVTGATGSGFVTVDYDNIAHTLLIDADWTGLSGTTTVAHIHCCTAAPRTGTVGVAVTPGTLPGFPVGVSAGSYSTLLDLTQTTTFVAGFLTGGGGTVAGAENRLINGINAGLAYFNVHSTTFAGGEIRGFLAPIPEPETYALMLVGLAAVGVAARRRKH